MDVSFLIALFGLDQETVENEYNVRSMSPNLVNGNYSLRKKNSYSLITNKVYGGISNRQIKTSRYSNDLNADLWVIPYQTNQIKIKL